MSRSGSRLVCNGVSRPVHPASRELLCNSRAPHCQHEWRSPVDLCCLDRLSQSVTPLDPSTSWDRQVSCGPKIRDPLQQSGQDQAHTGQLQAMPLCSMQGQITCLEGETREMHFHIQQRCSLHPSAFGAPQDSGFMPHMPGNTNQSKSQDPWLARYLVTAVPGTGSFKGRRHEHPARTHLLQPWHAWYQCSSRQCLLLAAGQHLCLFVPERAHPQRPALLSTDRHCPLLPSQPSSRQSENLSTPLKPKNAEQ